MTKEKFVEFLTYIYKYNFKADVKCIIPKVTIASTQISITLFTHTGGYVDYGDYTHESFKKEFKELLIEDGFIDNKKNPLDEVEDIEKWEVWLNITDGDKIYAGVHLFDYSDNGLQLIGKSANYK